MVSTLTLGELFFSVVLLVAYVVWFVFKYRKTSGFLPAVIWGIGAFFIMNVVTNVLRNLILTSVAGNTTELVQAFSDNNKLLSLLISTSTSTLGAIFAGYFLYRMQHKKPAYNDKTMEINGFSAGLFSILNPFSSALMAIVNYIMYAFAINKGEDLLKLNEALTAENIETIKKLLIGNEAFNFLYVAVVTVIISFSYGVFFRMMDRRFKKEYSIKSILLIAVIFFAFNLVLNGVGMISGIPKILLVVVSIASGAALLFAEKRFFSN